MEKFGHINQFKRFCLISTILVGFGLQMIEAKGPSGRNGECIDDPIDWYDSDGPAYDCEWYARRDHCKDYGDSYENNGKIAKKACCACGGGRQDGGNRFSSFNQIDIGDAEKGRSTDRDGGYWVIGAGSGVGGSTGKNDEDSFHFAYKKRISGERFKIIVDVSDQLNTNAWATAGLMIRNSLDDDSEFIYVAITPDNGFILQERPENGQRARTLTNHKRWASPSSGMLTLVKEGHVYSAYVGYGEIGSVTNKNFGKHVYYGMAVSSKDEDNLSKAKFQNFRLLTW